MYNNSNSIPNNGKIGPPPSMGGYQNRTNKNSEGVVEHSNYPAPTSGMPATYAPPSYAPPSESINNQNNFVSLIMIVLSRIVSQAYNIE